MPEHTAACQLVLAEMLTTPTHSVTHRIAEYVDGHSAAEGFDLLITVMDEDPPRSEPTLAAARLLPSIVAEVVA